MRAQVEFGERTIRLELTPAEAAAALAGDRVRALVRPLPPRPEDRAAGRERREVVVDGWRFEVELEDAVRARLRERAARLGATAGSGARRAVRAQIPGRVVGVDVALGDEVTAGQRLLTVEAMKMENEVRAPRTGTIERVTVVVGQTVDQGDELVVIG